MKSKPKKRLKDKKLKCLYFNVTPVLVTIYGDNINDVTLYPGQMTPITARKHPLSWKRADGLPVEAIEGPSYNIRSNMFLIQGLKAVNAIEGPTHSETNTPGTGSCHPHAGKKPKRLLYRP